MALDIERDLRKKFKKSEKTLIAYDIIKEKLDEKRDVIEADLRVYIGGRPSVKYITDMDIDMTMNNPNHLEQKKKREKNRREYVVSIIANREEIIRFVKMKRVK